MNVILHRDFEKKFAKLDAKLRLKFIERKDMFLADPSHPFLNNHELHREWQGCRSINVTGNYRAIFREIGKDTIEFLDIGTHPELYGS